MGGMKGPMKDDKGRPTRRHSHLEVEVLMDERRKPIGRAKFHLKVTDHFAKSFNAYNILPDSSSNLWR